MKEKDSFTELMGYLRKLKREGATITSWLPHYESLNGKHTGKFWIDIEGEEKI